MFDDEMQVELMSLILKQSGTKGNETHSNVYEIRLFSMLGFISPSTQYSVLILI
jgi:hypothetical protein